MSILPVNSNTQLWNTLSTGLQNEPQSVQSGINSYKSGNAYQVTLSQDALQKAKNKLQTDFSGVMKDHASLHHGVKTSKTGTGQNSGSFASSLLTPLVDGKSVIQSQGKGNIVNVTL